MKKISKAVFAALLMLVFTQACKGPQGDPGPAGPQGEKGSQGVQGVQGIAGKDGSAGKDGTSIKFSKWESYNNWSSAVSSGGYFHRSKLNIGLGTFLTNGVFLVFISSGAGQLLPFTISPPIEFYYEIEKLGNSNVLLDLRAKTTSASYLEDFRYNNQSFRWIYIPDASSGRKANIDYSDYEAVKKAYNIPD